MNPDDVSGAVRNESSLLSSAISSNSNSNEYLISYALNHRLKDGTSISSYEDHEFNSQLNSYIHDSFNGNI